MQKLHRLLRCHLQTEDRSFEPKFCITTTGRASLKDCAGTQPAVNALLKGLDEVCQALERGSPHTSLPVNLSCFQEDVPACSETCRNSAGQTVSPDTHTTLKATINSGLQHNSAPRLTCYHAKIHLKKKSKNDQTTKQQTYLPNQGEYRKVTHPAMSKYSPAV